MPKLRRVRGAAVLAATAIALTGALAAATSAQASTTDGAAAASSVHPMAACMSTVGDSEVYHAYGTVAGTIRQVYDSCGEIGPAGYTYAAWTWNTAFQQAHSGSHVELLLGSMGMADGSVQAGPYFDANGPTTVYFGMPHDAANPDSWRAGAELDGSNCAAWTSQHYYANGTETAGPYGGCNDTVNISSIPWTKP